jgi:hypothetical protein
MVQFNFSERTIKAKVVYYGPAQSGKTTNLEQVHALTDPVGRNRLVSLNTAQDRTLFFDLLPFSLGSVSGYDFQVQLYTVPGQVQYNATRRVVLAGADAVVFVADSRRSMGKENLAAFENMKVNLLANRLVPEKVPLVLQWNKRDLPDVAEPDELNRALNPWGRPSFTAVAPRGEGVLETFSAVVQQMLGAIAVKYNLKEKGLDPAAVPELVQGAFNALLERAKEEVPAEGAAQVRPAKVVLAQAPDAASASLQASPDTGLVAEELLARSIKSNVEMAEALSTISRQMSDGLGAILSQAELLKGYRDEPLDKRSASVDAIHRDALRLRKMVQDMGQIAQSAGSGSASVPPTPTRPPAPPAARPASPPRPAPPAPAAPTSLETILREALEEARDRLTARGVTVALSVPPGLAMPRGGPEKIRRAVGSLLEGATGEGASAPKAALRCERKPVLLRGKAGEEIRRDFAMIALVHANTIAPDAQQRVLQGADAGPLGEAWRTVREVGGFMRFSTLASGELETRLFLPLP